MEETALIEVERLDVAKLFSDTGMTEILTGIAARAKELVSDISTDTGRKEIASMAWKVARSKTLIDDLGKDTMAEWKKKVDRINGYRKQARDFLDNLKDEVRRPLTEYEEEQEKIRAAKVVAEEKRVQEIRAKIDRLKAFPFKVVPANDTVCIINGLMLELSGLPVNEEIFQEFIEEAIREKEKSLAILNEFHQNRLTFETQQKATKEEAERLEKQRKAQEEETARLKAIMDEVEEKQRKERETLEAERRKIEADKAAFETEKRKEEERKVKAERDRKAAEEAKLEAEKQVKKKAEREEALKPDREKLIAWANEILEIQSPELTSKEARIIANHTLSDMHQCARDLIEDVGHLAEG